MQNFITLIYGEADDDANSRELARVAVHVEGDWNAENALDTALSAAMAACDQELARHALEARLAEHMEALAQRFLPAVGARRASEVKAVAAGGSPDGDKTVTIAVGGAHAGRWFDFASQQHGGPLDLIAWARTPSSPGTVEEAADLFLAGLAAEASALGNGKTVDPALRQASKATDNPAQQAAE